MSSHVEISPVFLQLGSVTLELAKRCHFMGIVNVTPDSFSDGGKYLDRTTAVEQAIHLVSEGADIIDIGGESTRPGAESVSESEEIRRVIPVIKEIRRRSSIPISIDTRKASVAEAAIEAGASMVNDISALQHDLKMVEVVKQNDVPVVLMHMKGIPKTMQRNPKFYDVLQEVMDFFSERLTFCKSRGVRQVIIDPGIGFGKRLEDNLILLRELHVFRSLGVPLLVGTSRKSFIGEITGLPIEDRLSGTIASNVLAYLNGAVILRVHDVKEVRAAIEVVNAIRKVKGRDY